MKQLIIYIILPSGFFLYQNSILRLSQRDKMWVENQEKNIFRPGRDETLTRIILTSIIGGYMFFLSRMLSEWKELSLHQRWGVVPTTGRETEWSIAE